MKTTEKKNTRRPGAPNIACLPTSDGGDCPRKERSDAPVVAAAGGKNSAGHLQATESTDRCADAQRGQGDGEADEGHSAMPLTWSRMGALPGQRQLGPQRLPVLWAKLRAGHCTFRLALDSHAVAGTRLAIGIPVLPLANLSVALGTNPLTQLGNSQGLRAGKVLVKVHGHALYSDCYILAIAFALVAAATVLR